MLLFYTGICLVLISLVLYKDARLRGKGDGLMDERFYPALILMSFVLGYAIKRVTFGFFQARSYQTEAQRKHNDLATTVDRDNAEVEQIVPRQRPRMCRTDSFFFDPQNGNSCFCGNGI